MTYPTPWVDYDSRQSGVYGHEAKCWETAVFDSAGNQVGKTMRGVLGYTGRGNDSFSKFGLTVKQRQFKEFVPPAPRPPQEKYRAVVRIETHNENGIMIDLTVDTRMVYVGKKGEYIKTRSEGNPVVTYVNHRNERVIVKEMRPYVYKGAGTGKQMTVLKTYVVTPEEWSKR